MEPGVFGEIGSEVGVVLEVVAAAGGGGVPSDGGEKGRTSGRR